MNQFRLSFTNRIIKEKLGVKKLSVTATLTSSDTLLIEVPDDYTLEEAIKYAKSSLNAIDFSYSDGSFSIDDEYCAFDESE